MELRMREYEEDGERSERRLLRIFERLTMRREMYMRERWEIPERFVKRGGERVVRKREGGRTDGGMFVGEGREEVRRERGFRDVGRLRDERLERGVFEIERERVESLSA
ncbi:hypothetical protein Tco_0557437 [Tanacetum coccineum]